MSVNAWGWDLALDAGCCNRLKICDAENIRAFSKELVEAIDMEAFGECQVVHFGKDDKCGYTMVQLITTSNIVCHFSEDSSSLFLNVFSCKPFNKLVVKDVVKKYFECEYTTMNMLERSVP